MESSTRRGLISWPIRLEGKDYGPGDLAALPPGALGDTIRQLAGQEDSFTVMTSGSTGKPKSIRIKKEDAALSAQATSRALGLGPVVRALLSLDPEPIAGRMMIWRALHLGWNLSFEEPKRRLERPGPGEEFDLAAWIPLQLAEADLETADRIGSLLIGGGPMTPASEAKAARTRARVIHTYGMTETLTHVALRPVNGPLASARFRPLPGVRLELDREECLVIEAPWCGRQSTRDLADLGSDGSFVILGRADFAINSGGVKIIPEQLEAELSGQIEGRFAVVGAPHPDWGEEPVLVVSEVGPELGQLQISRPRWRPRRIATIPEPWPETRTGKLDRRALRQKVQEL
jgi:O-succinylbenzoic acid--CoA ligase